MLSRQYFRRYNANKVSNLCFNFMTSSKFYKNEKNICSSSCIMPLTNVVSFVFEYPDIDLE